MTSKLARLMLVAVIGLMLVACGSDAADNKRPDDVPSLATDDTQRAEPTAVAEEELLDDQARMMAFTQCMRDEGIELVDAGVDAKGNVQRPTLAEGAQVSDLHSALWVRGYKPAGTTRLALQSPSHLAQAAVVTRYTF
jgi:hypothetical protein